VQLMKHDVLYLFSVLCSVFIFLIFLRSDTSISFSHSMHNLFFILASLFVVCEY
jgi:hypothetical protein